MKPYTIDAIETEYKGIIFRSRLEATWAVFFDLLGWRWEYEPRDFDGWIPDFALRGENNKIVYVEVKPTFVFLEDVADKMSKATPENTDLLLVGLGPWTEDNVVKIGWTNESEPEPPKDWWADAPMGIWEGSESGYKNPKHIIGFCHETGRFVDRMSGCYDGGTYGGVCIDNFDDSIMRIWGKAKKTVQYNHIEGKTK
jgi:hypothetical protein